jgi:hypothetical protein
MFMPHAMRHAHDACTLHPQASRTVTATVMPSRGGSMGHPQNRAYTCTLAYHEAHSAVSSHRSDERTAAEQRSDSNSEHWEGQTAAVNVGKVRQLPPTADAKADSRTATDDRAKQPTNQPTTALGLGPQCQMCRTAEAMTEADARATRQEGRQTHVQPDRRASEHACNQTGAGSEAAALSSEMGVACCDVLSSQRLAAEAACEPLGRPIEARVSCGKG